MGIKVQYTGDRSYTEFRTANGPIGFSRGMIREMDNHHVDMVRAMIDNGSTMWKIVDDKPTQSDAMKSVIEPTVEETVESTDEEVEVDYTALSRAKLMALCKERGIPVKNTSKKADLVALLTA